LVIVGCANALAENKALNNRGAIKNFGIDCSKRSFSLQS